ASANRQPTTQARRSSGADGIASAIDPVVRKIPEPITLPMTSRVALTGPMARSSSLMAKRVDGIEARRPPRRVEAEHHPDGEGQRARPGARRLAALTRPLDGALERPRSGDADEDAGHAAGDAEQHRLAQELRLDGPLRRADGQADADLARPLHHRREHDVH